MIKNSSNSLAAESVAVGHPDKLADRIADAVLDLYLTYDPRARVACEVLLAHEMVILAGEFHAMLGIDGVQLQQQIDQLVRKVILAAGYTSAEDGIDPYRCQVLLRLNQQSPDISRGVTRGGDALGAGDQGVVFGFACDETSEYLPLPVVLAHRLMRQQAEVRRQEGAGLRPDAKALVICRYLPDYPPCVERVIFSTQHVAAVKLAELRELVRCKVIDQVIPVTMRTQDFQLWINPAGKFVTGGPKGDTGLTGRKLMVDTYGGIVPHGGGAFSGKDPSKVDRTGAYLARFLAKQVIARGLARRVLVGLVYAIGLPRPVAFTVDTFGSGLLTDHQIAEALEREFDFSVAGTIAQLKLLRPIYYDTAVYGHFGRLEQGFPWEAVV